MADTSEKRLQGGELGETQCGETETYDTTAKRSNDGWPARPGQTQYEWEEPRVVGDTKAVNGEQPNRETSESGGTKEEDRGPSGEGVVAHSKCEGLEGQRDNKTKKHREDKGLQFRSEDGGNGNTRETQPELGGAAYGTSSGVDSTANRVDRLRLLGNGVVPQTCERALRVLMERLHSK